MKIKQDPITKLWCREDGAVLMPPCRKFRKFRWTFGYKQPDGYRRVGYCGKPYLVHQIICRAFNGLAPEGKPFVDHINRVKSANFASNLRWVSAEENQSNTDSVDRSVERYKVRHCKDKKSYHKAYNKAHREERKAYDATKAAKMKAKGLTFRKGPDGKWGWYPRVHS